MTGRGESKWAALLIVSTIMLTGAGMAGGAAQPDSTRGVPYIVSTNPVDGATGVAPGTWAYVVVWSEPMISSSPTIVPTPVMPTMVWSGGNTIFTIFATWAPGTIYNLNFANSMPSPTGDLVKVFSTGDGTPPSIITTNPVDYQSMVPPGQQFTTFWSEVMSKAAGSVSISPAPYIPGTWQWSADGQYLNYTGMSWSANSHYTLTFINFTDLAGTPAFGDLVKEFETEIHPEFWAPYGLTVAKAASDVVLSWEEYGNIGPNNWYVYRSLDKFATFPSAWTMATVPGTTLTWTHAGAANDGNTWYYMVQAEGGMPGLSSMGVKQHKALYHNAYPWTNINWLTIPQDSGYSKASDIVMELEGALTGPGLDSKICVVGKWMPQYQASTAYVYDDVFEEWTGDDFAILPGDGLYLSITSDFNWVVCGVDTETPLNFTHNSLPKTNIMWFNLPATCNYQRASDIVLELEGALMGPYLDSKINVIGYWMVGSQAATAFFYDSDFEEWGGDDFLITPGMGIYFSVTSDFTWTPDLVTAVVL